MRSKNIAIKSLVGYLVLMAISVIILNNIGAIINQPLMLQVSQIILQAICSLYLVYMINKYYGWINVGFKKINKKDLIWFIPHLSIILAMIYTLVKGIYLQEQSFDNNIWIILLMNFIGCLLAGASEEIIFRGMMLHSFLDNKSIIKPLVIGSLGFGVMHIATVFIGMPLIDALAGTIRACLVGMALVTLTIKINNIIPAILFHVLWNFILITSNMLNLEISKYALLGNPINLAIGIILGVIIIKNYKRNRKFVLKSIGDNKGDAI